MDQGQERVVALSEGPEHGRGQLGRAAGARLSALADDEAQPEITIVYNILAEPPGPAGYAVMDLEDEMWSLAPSLADTFALLVHLTDHAQQWDPTPVCRSPRHRPDGIVMTYRVLMADTSAAAGRAILANHAEGFYRHGDVAASPTARGGYFATAFDRDGLAARLAKLALDAPPADVVTALGVPETAQIDATGTADSALPRLLDALHARWRRLTRS